MLRDGKQPRPLRRDGDTVQRVSMEHAPGVVPRGVDGAVNDEAGRVHGEGRILQLVSVHIDLDQARRRDLVEEHAVGIDEELVLGARHPRRDVREHQVLPAVVRHEPITGGEIHPHRPLFGRDLVPQRRDVVSRGVHRGSPCRRDRGLLTNLVTQNGGQGNPRGGRLAQYSARRSFSR